MALVRRILIQFSIEMKENENRIVVYQSSAVRTGLFTVRSSAAMRTEHSVFGNKASTLFTIHFNLSTYFYPKLRYKYDTIVSAPRQVEF